MKKYEMSLIHFDYFLAVLSGILLILSFPKIDCGILIWIGLVPLLLALKNNDKKKTFVLGLITGLTFYFGSIYWIVIATYNYGNLNYIISILKVSLSYE